jgi:hypothetical protein
MSKKAPYVKEWADEWAEYNTLPKEIKEQYLPYLKKMVAVLRDEASDYKTLVNLYFSGKDTGRVVKKALGIVDPKLLNNPMISAVERIAYYERYRELRGEV